MASFVVKLGTAEGSVVTRTLEGRDEAAVRADIARQGGRIFSIRSTEQTTLAQAGGRLLRRKGRPVKMEEFLIFNQELVALLRAGLPVMQGFDILIERQENPRLRATLHDIRDQIKSGVALSDAFLSHGEMFPRLYATSLKAGERSGEVEKVLRRYLEYQKILGSVKRKVTAALIYPAVLITLSIGLVVVLMTYVIPKFTEFFEGFGVELPLLTRVVVATANFMKDHLAWEISGVIILVVAFVQWKKTPKGAVAFDALLLKIPLVGKILRQFALSQFCRALATLAGSGTPLVPALEISAGSIANLRIGNAVSSVVPKVREGAELWRSLEATGQFTSLTVEMIKVGEATGSLDEMLMNVSSFYDESIDSALQKLITLIEPIILVFMASIISTILLAVYLPMFTILSNIKT